MIIQYFLCLLSIRILLPYLVFGDDLEDVGGVLSTMELPLSDLVSKSAANLFESAVDLSIKLQIEKTLHMDYCQKLINYE